LFYIQDHNKRSRRKSAVGKEVQSNTSQCESGPQPKYYSTGKVYFIDLDSRKTTEGTNFWSGEGTEDMVTNDLTLLDDGNGSVKYSNQSAKDFSNSHSELKRLSVKADNLYADHPITS
jgi:hypothetical protein